MLRVGRHKRLGYQRYLGETEKGVWYSFKAGNWIEIGTGDMLWFHFQFLNEKVPEHIERSWEQFQKGDDNGQDNDERSGV